MENSKYEVINDAVLGEILRRNNEDGSVSFIPTDPANSDYAAYLAHLTESLPTSKP